MGLRRFFWLWLQTAFRHAFGRADAIAGFLGMSLPALARLNSEWRDALAELSWQIPLGLFGGLFVVRLVLAPYWMYREVQSQQEQVEPNDPRVRVLPLIDRGKAIMVRCEGSDAPPIEAAEQWRGSVKDWLSANHLEPFIPDWDRFPGVSPLDPALIPGFSGFMSRDNKPTWDGLNIRILRLEELVRRL